MDVRAFEARTDAELEQALADFRSMVESATRADLRRRSNGTRWTNRQLLFHMVLGYGVVRTLMPMVHVLGRRGWSRRFAATLDAAAGPFHLVNYVGSAVAGQVLPPSTTVALLARTVSALQRRLATEDPDSLDLTMHFPTRWDPYFEARMSVADVYCYPTRHFEHHRRQLSLQDPVSL
jgi:hypothetical protein